MDLLPAARSVALHRPFARRNRIRFAVISTCRDATGGPNCLATGVHAPPLHTPPRPTRENKNKPSSPGVPWWGPESTEEPTGHRRPTIGFPRVASPRSGVPANATPRAAIRRRRPTVRAGHATGWCGCETSRQTAAGAAACAVRCGVEAWARTFEAATREKSGILSLLFLLFLLSNDDDEEDDVTTV